MVILQFFKNNPTWNNPENRRNLITIGILASIAIALHFINKHNARYTEVTWKDFATKYLANNMVSMLVQVLSIHVEVLKSRVLVIVSVNFRQKLLTYWCLFVLNQTVYATIICWQDCNCLKS